MLEKLRNNPPAEIGGYKVLEFRDYEKDIVKRADGSTGTTGLPESNVLYLTLKTMHGAVQDLQEPNQRLSSIWVLRETALRMRIRNLPASKKA